MLTSKEGNQSDKDGGQGVPGAQTNRRYSLLNSAPCSWTRNGSPTSVIEEIIGGREDYGRGETYHGNKVNNRNKMSQNFTRRNTATGNELPIVGGSSVCQRCQRFEVDLTNTFDNLSATDTELKASRQVISLLQRQLELFQIEKEGLEKLIVSQANNSSTLGKANDMIDLDGNPMVDDGPVDPKAAEANQQSPDDAQRKLLRLIRTQLYEKDAEIVQLKASLKSSQNEKEQMSLQIHTLEDDVTKLKAEIALLKENLALRDQTIVSLSNEVFEQSNTDMRPSNQRRQSSAETLMNSQGRSERKQLIKLNETLEAYKKTNELLSQNVLKLTDKCGNLERKEMESKSQALELEARCCQIQSKLLSLLKEIEQSSKPTAQEGGDEQSTEKAEFINHESVKLLIKRLLEDKSLDIPLSWKEGNRPRSRKNDGAGSSKLECDELGFYISSTESVKQTSATSESSPRRKPTNRRPNLTRGISEGTYLSHLATVEEHFEVVEEASLLRDDRQQTVDSMKSDGASWRLHWDEFIKDFDKTNMSKSRELKMLLRSGVPQEYRCKVWKALIDLRIGPERRQHEPDYYQNLTETKQQANGSKQSMNPCSKQIELDLLRTLPSNKYFETIDSPGTVRLRKVLTAFASHKPHIGYCQGMNRLAAVALLVLPEEEAFWCLVSIVDKIMPSGYYNDLWLAQVDSNVVMDFVAIKMPELSDHFQAHDIELSLFAWFLTIFVDGTPPALFLRLWDCFLYEGDKTMFRVALALLKMNEKELFKFNSSVAVNSFLRATINEPIDLDEFFKIAFEKINPLPGRVLRQKREANFHAIRASLRSLAAAKSPKPAEPATGDAEVRDEESLIEDSSVISI